MTGVGWNLGMEEVWEPEKGGADTAPSRLYGSLGVGGLAIRSFLAVLMESRHSEKARFALIDGSDALPLSRGGVEGRLRLRGRLAPWLRQ